MGVALDVLPNEPCFNLSEMDLQTPGSKGWHRIQRLVVVRGDRLAEYREDLGPREHFKAPPFRIPGGYQTDEGKYEIVHSVAELQDLALTMRSQPLATPMRLRGKELFNGYYDVAEQRADIIGAKA